MTLKVFYVKHVLEMCIRDRDKDKAEAFSTFYAEKAGSKTLWPKTLTPEEMQIFRSTNESK